MLWVVFISSTEAGDIVRRIENIDNTPHSVEVLYEDIPIRLDKVHQ